MSLKDRIQDEMKAAMRAHDKQRLGAIRLILAAVQQQEIDERITLDDTRIVAVLNRMVKQRHDSITQFQRGGRENRPPKKPSRSRLSKVICRQP